MSDTKLNIPVLSKDKSFEHYKLELGLWKSLTTQKPEKLGPLVALSLPDDHESKIKDKVFSEISIEDLQKADGYDTLIKLMEKHLLNDALSDAFEKYNDFEFSLQKSHPLLT